MIREHPIGRQIGLSFGVTVMTMKMGEGFVMTASPHSNTVIIVMGAFIREFMPAS